MTFSGVSYFTVFYSQDRGREQDDSKVKQGKDNITHSPPGYVFVSLLLSHSPGHTTIASGGRSVWPVKCDLCFFYVLVTLSLVQWLCYIVCWEGEEGRMWGLLSLLTLCFGMQKKAKYALKPPLPPPSSRWRQEFFLVCLSGWRWRQRTGVCVTREGNIWVGVKADSEDPIMP